MDYVVDGADDASGGAAAAAVVGKAETGDEDWHWIAAEAFFVEVHLPMGEPHEGGGENLQCDKKLLRQAWNFLPPHMSLYYYTYLHTSSPPPSTGSRALAGQCWTSWPLCRP